jgi:Family of unknown function (DUF6157)
MHSTNYVDTFITVAPDSVAVVGAVPKAPAAGKPPTVAWLTFDLVHSRPYTATSDDVLFAVFAIRSAIAADQQAAARATFFSKPQACLRASDLAKKHGWGIHHDAHSRIALIGVETEAYARFTKDAALTIKAAMRSTRAG